MSDNDIIAAVAPDAVSLMDKAIAEIKRLRAENSTLTAERDEARKMCCELEARIIVLEEDRRDTSNKFGTNPCSEIILADSPLARYPKEIAKRKGWDCFKEEVACDTLSQEVSQEGSKLPTTISSNGIRITEYIPPQMSVREIPSHDAYTTGECFLQNISVDKSYEKIIDKHNDLFQKLAQEEKTND